MHEPDSEPPFDSVSRSTADADDEPSEIETVLTTVADVESAGRSCLAIVVLAGVILVVLLLWIVVRSTAGG